MTPEQRKEFETSWRDLHPRLRAMFSARRIHPDRLEDLIQETALRLYRMWERVDRSRPSWPLAKTIALNLLRDEFRAHRLIEPLDDVPEKAFDYDLEAQGIARIELERVRVALDSLTAIQRRAILEEIGISVPREINPSAEKMVRSRARKRLATLLEEVSAVVSLRWAKLPDLFQGVGLFRGAGNTAVACLMCLFGASVAAIGVGPLAEPAKARPAHPRTLIQPQASAQTLGHTPAQSMLRETTAVKGATAASTGTGSKSSRAGKDGASGGSTTQPGALDPGSVGTPTELGLPGASPEEVPSTDTMPATITISSAPETSPDGEGEAVPSPGQVVEAAAASLSSTKLEDPNL
jgi:hypothetical protein